MCHFICYFVSRYESSSLCHLSLQPDIQEKVGCYLQQCLKIQAYFGCVLVINRKVVGGFVWRDAPTPAMPPVLFLVVCRDPRFAPNQCAENDVRRPLGSASYPQMRLGDSLVPTSSSPNCVDATTSARCVSMSFHVFVCVVPVATSTTVCTLVCFCGVHRGHWCVHCTNASAAVRAILPPVRTI